MAIACPYCAHKLNLKSPKPGRFRPDCPACGRQFAVVVPDPPGATVKVRALAAGRGSSRELPETVGPPLALEATPPSAASAPVVVSADLSSAGFDLDFLPTDPVAGKRPAPESPDQPAADRSPPRLEACGYAVERELGRGGMGTVFLARQLSLDRPVALKVMSRRWATDPVFVARFTREAYAAAQLSHPNIVQIYDLGEVDGRRFFSMEYVRGKSLSELLKARGKLDPETAVGYVLQAARGLKHAHDRGMIHRDVKPDNLLLDDEGVVKVADLGLVKTPAARRDDDRPACASSAGLAALPAGMTGARIALGTPAYMSPEQCRDAAAVDHRADIYSLGCTLYVLVTGQQPFNGTTAVELMTKHAYEAVVPPEQIVSRVPKEVSAVIQRMMEKNANDRFQSMAEVIRTLEAWLGVRHAGTFCPQDEQITRLEGYVEEYNTAPTAVLRRRLLTGFFAALALAAVLIAFFGDLVWAFGLAGLAVQSALAYFVLDGVARRGHLFTRTRQFVAGLTWGDWAVAAASVGLFLVLLAMLQVFWVWAGFGLIGVGLAFALRYGLDRPAEEERRGPVDACEKMLRRLRGQGLDEEEIRQFVAKFAGREWEAFFEALFGYEAKLSARAMLLRGGAAGARDRHAAWREPLIALMDRVERRRREARERKLLEAVERAQLLAAGVEPGAAEHKAKAAAAAMVHAAGEARQSEERRARVGLPTQPAGHPVNVHEAMAVAEENPFAFVPAAPRRREPAVTFVGLFVGAHVRVVLAAVLLAACGLWAYQNGLVPGSAPAAESSGAGTRPLEIAGVPASATKWADGWSVGAAGLLLLASLFYRGNVMAVFVLLGAAVAAAGDQCGIRTVEPFRAEHVALMLGSVLALIGFRTAR